MCGINSNLRTRILVGMMLLAFAATSFAGQVLNNNQTTLIKGAQGDKLIYHIQVPANAKQLVVTLNNGLGDADLYLKHEKQSNSAAVSNKNPKSEKVVMPGPVKGRWDIMIIGKSFFMNVQLRASFSLKATNKPPSPNSMAGLGNGHWVHNQNGKGPNRRYEIHVPHNAGQLVCQVTGGKGQTALLVRHGAPATLQHHDHGTAWTGTSQKIVIQNPKPGPWFLLLDGRPEFKGVSVMARYSMKNPGNPGKPGQPKPPKNPGKGGGSPQTIANLGPGHWVHNQNGRDNNRHYRIDVPKGAKRLIFNTKGGHGNFALLVRRFGLASPQHHERARWGKGTHKTVTWNNPPAGTYYALLHGQSEFRNVSVVAHIEMH